MHLLSIHRRRLYLMVKKNLYAYTNESGISLIYINCFAYIYIYVIYMRTYNE